MHLTLRQILWRPVKGKRIFEDGLSFDYRLIILSWLNRANQERNGRVYWHEKNVTQSVSNESINIPLIFPIRPAQRSKNNKGISPYVLVTKFTARNSYILSFLSLWNEQSHSVEKRKKEKERIREETRGFRCPVNSLRTAIQRNVQEFSRYIRNH